MAEIIIYSPEIKVPSVEGQPETQQIALTGTTLSIEKKEAFPSTGDASLFYFAEDENTLYRWHKTKNKYVIVNPDGQFNLGTSEGLLKKIGEEQ
jgi:hypothetical protein